LSEEIDVLDSAIGTVCVFIQNRRHEARTQDTLLYEGKDYAILRVTPYEGLFDPKQFGITPEMLLTGAYRGFVCYYSIVHETLRLSSLEIRAKDDLHGLREHRERRWIAQGGAAR